ncbi:hypothetical protein HDU85_007444 [Gaertneriomyces sp. JEL0708]|nr:hypothetical protein HDU85_007444 [Gaertneriomyces sp. JEL0708]
MPVSVSAAGSSDIGRRTSQQDEYLFLSSFLEGVEDSYIFAVFDGHGADGGKVAAFVKQEIVTVLNELKEDLLREPEPALKNAYKLVHERLIENQAIDTYMAGTTAAIALIIGKKLLISHVGDSRVLLGRRGPNSNHYIQKLTNDHTCDDAVEKERVLAAGARVEPLSFGDPSGPLRIFKGSLPYPGLIVTRAIGDSVVNPRYGITSEPDVTILDITEAFAFLILGTDGVWDGISIEEALDIASKESDPTVASKTITQRSLDGMDRNHLDDNTTNIVAYLHLS